MAVLLSEVTTQGWRLGEPRAVGELTIHPIWDGNDAPMVQLVPKSAIGDCTTPFAPSTFKGLDEPRRGIVFAVSDAVAEAWGRIEVWAAKAIKGGQFVPSLRQYDRFSGIKAKIDIRRAIIVDIHGNSAPFPENWAITLVPILKIRGIYVQGGSYGLLVEVEGLMLGPPRRRELTFV